MKIGKSIKDSFYVAATTLNDEVLECFEKSIGDFLWEEIWDLFYPSVVDTTARIPTSLLEINKQK
jgi:hypothetical protein